MNLVMGEKIAWRLIIEGPTWWKKVLEGKYTSSKQQKLLRSPPNLVHISGNYIKKIPSSRSSPQLQNSKGARFQSPSKR